MADARRALLERLIDHAPLFPPASLPMAEALEEDRRFRASPDGWLVRRFVCPASKFEELGDELVPLAIVVDVESDERPWGDDPRVSAVETLPRVASGNLGAIEHEVYAEVHIDDPLLADKLHALRDLGLRAKVRCGGATIPSVAELGGFVRSCRELALPFKGTAGLHDPIRTGGEHGFLNVAAAALFGDEEDALADDDFTLSEDRFSWGGRSASAEELTRLRRELFSGFGSCSAQEPADELRALGFLPG